MTSTQTAAAPVLNARVIALAHYAARALAEDALARHGVTFNQSVVLRAIAVAGQSIGRADLVAEVTGALKVDNSFVEGVVGELTAAELVETDPAQPSRMRLTDAGRDLYTTTSAETAKIAARLYDGIPAEDLEIAGRVLTLITRRANADSTAAGATDGRSLTSTPAA